MSDKVMSEYRRADGFLVGRRGKQLLLIAVLAVGALALRDVMGEDAPVAPLPESGTG